MDLGGRIKESVKFKCEEFEKNEETFVLVVSRCVFGGVWANSTIW